MILRLSLCLVLLCALAACGDLPQPFLGNPGATARRLAQPPTPRLAVVTPGDALLTDRASRGLADDLAHALQAQAVPAYDQPPQHSDWRLLSKAESHDGAVVPVFTVVNPKGVAAGDTKGAPVPQQLWADASPAMLHAVAIDAAPKIARLLTGIQVAREQADPNSLYNRPAKVMVAEVTGAPGDGDYALTRQMRTRLRLLGPKVQTTAKGADFTVRGHVRIVPLKHHKERVEIQWHIRNAKGQDLGKVVQLNEIPAGTLDHYWGDVAVVVATEASGGVDDVIKQQHATPARAGVQPAAVHGQVARRLLEPRGSGAHQPVRQ